MKMENVYLRNVIGISQTEKALITDYLKEVISDWTQNNKGWFAARDLVGGDHSEWSGTPLIVLYNKHISKGKAVKQAVSDAAKDLGWLLKSTLNNSPLEYESGRKGLTAAYRLSNQK